MQLLISEFDTTVKKVHNKHSLGGSKCREVTALKILFDSGY